MTAERSATELPLAELGSFLRRRREELDLKIPAVAAQAGISPAYLRVIESGVNPKTKKPSRPAPDAIVGVAHALKLNPPELLARAGYVDPAEVAEAITTSGSLGSIRDSQRQIQRATAQLDARTPFFVEETDAWFRGVAAEFTARASGFLRCSPSEEPDLTKKAAVKACQRTLSAVSYQDEAWWQGSDGDTYLRAHEVLVSRGVAMTRVFIVSADDAQSKLRATFVRHEALGIEWYAVEPRHVPQSLWEDFVLYDDGMLRRALSGELRRTGKSAEFTEDPALVGQAVSNFEQILGIAQRNALDPSELLAPRRTGQEEADSA